MPSDDGDGGARTRGAASLEVSTIDAARSGVADMVVLSAEQREELEVVETQIKQKIAIGATMSKRHLIDDLSASASTSGPSRARVARHDPTRRRGGESRGSSRHENALDCNET